MAEVAKRTRSAASAKQAPLGRLRRYRVVDLFGTFTYDFELARGGPTLLTGVNGTGKSTILRSIDAVSTSNWPTLLEFPFTELTLEFESKKEIKVVRDSRTARISLTGAETWEYPGKLNEINIDELHAVERRLGEVVRAEKAIEETISARRSEASHATREGARLEQVQLERERARLEQVYAERAQLEILRRHAHTSFPAWASNLSESFPVLFITDQRLIIDSPRRTSETSTRVAADVVARQIAREISAVTRAYGNRSQALDHDFPQRVIRSIKNPPKVTDQELRTQLDELTRRSEMLESVGLLAKESVGEFEDLDLALVNVQPLIQTYIADSQRKLQVLEPLRVKLQLFSEFLRRHYGRKRILIDPEEGFLITAGARSRRPLPPSKLSSGEQQMMVLAHQILFKATPGTLVLIDEPELSLHVLWQATFVDDLADMGKVNNLSFLLATHSPTLIGGREDLKRSLDKMASE